MTGCHHGDLFSLLPFFGLSVPLVPGPRKKLIALSSWILYLSVVKELPMLGSGITKDENPPLPPFGKGG
jgi:hypothetical protein